MNFTEQQHLDAQNFASVKLLRQIYTERLQFGTDSIDFSKGYSESLGIDLRTFELLEDKFNIMKIKKEKLKSSHVFITINPSEDDLLQLLDRLKKCFTKSWLKAYLYSIEQRSSNSETAFYGYHVHILLPRGDKSPCEIIREIRSTFKGICGNDKSIDFKWVCGRGTINCYNYILGVKSSEDKEQKSLRDVEFRLLKGLQPYYTMGELELPQV